MNDNSAPPAKLAAHKLSIVLPVYNEQDCLPQVLANIRQVAATFPNVEIVLSDDGSTDATPALVQACVARDPRLRLVRNPVNCGQSAAMYLGFQAATGDLIVTLDADGQNDPTDIPTLLAPLLADSADVVCGYRATRKDSFSKRLASKCANALRRRLLQDNIRDTGCSLKAFRAPFVRNLQYWHGMHRFLPMLCAIQGARIMQCPVKHHARVAGSSKYTNWGRFKTTFGDLFGVRWLLSREKHAPAVAAVLLAHSSAAPQPTNIAPTPPAPLA